MTPITAIDLNATASDETQSSAPVKILGKDDFLNMLITQLAAPGSVEPH